MTVTTRDRVHKRRHQHRSLWLEEALACDGDDQPALQETISADVCIVGGGFTGLWTALRIRDNEPNASIVIVETDICGGGASGRNGGFMLSWWPKIETLIARVGTEEAARLARSSQSAVAEIGAFCEVEGISARFQQAGWLWTATSRAQMNAWHGAVVQCERLGEHPFRVLDSAEVQRRAGSPIYLGGVIEPSGAIIQPALLARGLRRVALARGVRIFEHSPMVGLDSERGIVRSLTGTVEARAIVLAMNAWAARLPELRRAIVPLSSDMVATEPVPDLLRQIGWTGGEAISNSRLMVHYYRTTQDGRIAFGRGGGALGFAGRIGPGFDHDAKRTRAVTRDLWRMVPGTRTTRITHAWGGPVDRSTDGLPFFGRLQGRCPVLYGVGFSGNGVAPSYIAGKILASTALGYRDEWSECGLNRGVPLRFPPEPFRFVGGTIVREAVRRKEEREDHGQGVDPVTRRLAALAPAGYFKVNPGQ